MIWGDTKRVPLITNKEGIDYRIDDYKEYKDFLYDYSYLLPANTKKANELQKQVGSDIHGWLTVKSIADNRQAISICDGRSCNRLAKHAGWYIADGRGYRPLYYAEFLYPVVVMRAFFVSVVLCFSVECISFWRRTQRIQKN
jgi:hypothetical protein